MAVYFDFQTDLVRPRGRPNGRGAALFSGDDGLDFSFIEPPFVPPWQQASRLPLAGLPNAVDQVGAATPSYNAGPQIGAIKSQPNFIGSQPQLLKASPGTLFAFIVNTAGSAAGGIYDANSLQGIVAANLICTIPMTVGIYVVDWPCQLGLAVAPGAGQVVAVKWA